MTDESMESVFYNGEREREENILLDDPSHRSVRLLRRKGGKMGEKRTPKNTIKTTEAVCVCVCVCE